MFIVLPFRKHLLTKKKNFKPFLFSFMSLMTSLLGTQKPAKGKRFGLLCDACKGLMGIFLKYW